MFKRNTLTLRPNFCTTLTSIVLGLCSFCGGSALADPSDRASRAATPSGIVRIASARLLRDGKPWVPHGFYQIAFESTPAYLGIKPFFLSAFQNYSPKEYADMRDAGADSVRIQVSQPGMDPRDPLFRPQFRRKVLGAIAAARAAGLTVFVSVQDEPQSGERNSETLPNAATQRVWRQIAPKFKTDEGVVFELFNEPSLPPSAANWAAWAIAMNATIATIRSLGASNVVVADGLNHAQNLAGAPRLDDSLRQVAFADHPYANNASEATAGTWDEKFGVFSQHAPVIITEWGTGYDKSTGEPPSCDPSTRETTVRFLQYLQGHAIGLEAGAWDWAARSFGTVRYNFPRGGFTKYNGAGPLPCNAPMFGPGATVEVWFKSGTPAAAPQ